MLFFFLYFFSSSDGSAHSFENNIEEYEEILVSCSLMTNTSIDILDGYCNDLVDFTIIRQSDMDICITIWFPRRKQETNDLAESEYSNWYRFIISCPPDESLVMSAG